MLSFISLVQFLEEKTGVRFGQDLGRWNDWVWSQPYEPHPDYGYLKGQCYSQIDPRFADFFPRGVAAAIRLDEIEWGGVAVNGIPPLRVPARLDAAGADYLEDDHVVFGIALNGEARAYPKRILAWHEMALDRLGGIELTIVYCTLCGTVIPSRAWRAGGGTRSAPSGLLYRSNKLMVRPRDPQPLEYVRGRAGGRRPARERPAPHAARRGDHHVGRVADAAPRHDGPVARDRAPPQLRRGRGPTARTSPPMR